LTPLAPVSARKLSAQKKGARQCLLKALPSPFALVEVPSLLRLLAQSPPEE
jgi:hypothetical protein